MTTTTANAHDAAIKLLYAADKGTDFTVGVLDLGKPFDVVADVEIGENLNEDVDEHSIRVSIVNLSSANRIALGTVSAVIKPQNNTPRRDRLRVPFGALANADPGDVIQAIGSYKVTAGINTDVSVAFSETFTVGG
ncbi:hypothetical protein ACFQFC_01730 [Amorphoplanes digitatis]|uniref:Uncharacterized protein n=1 Tax=Actinoplanes digitatis TaxID=1868 RepID=A0A7W7HY73_9ACTN|nr:hypothetical protein [Actinoplanes digitatis]MBB4762896.1 hypothetical protein [Actinoplanes digitatis]BFE71844.1 hypothetical protein GCM10020092_051450 [Actinoplanes digitatis]GID91609.1 hypothetical protein Adi01nite_10210 [Actinoplanes digitatis]